MLGAYEFGSRRCGAKLIAGRRMFPTTPALPTSMWVVTISWVTKRQDSRFAQTEAARRARYMDVPS